MLSQVFTVFEKLNIKPYYNYILPNYNQLGEWPLQFLRTGYYGRSLGFITSRTTDGIWWSDEAGSPTRGHFLYSTSGIVDAQEGNYHGFGIALGCVAPTRAFSKRAR